MTVTSTGRSRRATWCAVPNDNVREKLLEVNKSSQTQERKKGRFNLNNLMNLNLNMVSNFIFSALVLMLETVINNTCIRYGRNPERVPKGQRPRNRANHSHYPMVVSRLTCRSCLMLLGTYRGCGVPVGLPGGTFNGIERRGEVFQGIVIEIKTSIDELPLNNSLTLLSLLGKGVLEFKISAEISCSSIKQSCRILSFPGTMIGPRGLLGLLTSDHFDL